MAAPSKYKPEYCDKLLQHMDQGLSYEAFAGVIGVNRQTLYDWEKAHPEFLETKEIAVERSRVFWERQAILNLENRQFNAPIWIFNMKNRFGWRDKQKDEHDVVVNNLVQKSDEEIDARLRELTAKDSGETT